MACAIPSLACFIIPKCSSDFRQTGAYNGFTLCQFLMQDSDLPDVTYEQKQKLKFAFEQLKTKALQLNCWGKNELEGLPSTT